MVVTGTILACVELACRTARRRAFADWRWRLAWAALKASAVPQLLKPQLFIT